MLGPVTNRHLRIPCYALLCGALYRFRVPHPELLAAPAGIRRHRSTLAKGTSTPIGMRRMAAAAARCASTNERAHILSIATEYRQEAVILQRCAHLLGYRFQFAGIGEPWIGWGTKLVQYDRALRQGIHDGEIGINDPVLLIDGWDCALVGPAEEFIEKMASPPFSLQKVPWYAGERICGPDFFKANRIDDVYGDPQTPWKYPNAGAMCGRALEVLQLVQDLLGGSGDVPFPEDGNDQGRLHDHLLELGERGDPVPYRVDSRCSIFQCLYEAEPQWELEDLNTAQPRLRNKLTGEKPVVLHGNGHTGRWFMCSLWRDMNFLQRVGLTHEDLAHLPYDGPVAPGTIPDAATVQNWNATFQLYKIYEMQMAYARMGIEWDPWKEAEAAKAGSQI